MPTQHPHTAKAILLSCIDDRLAPIYGEFIASLDGGAFHSALAGGGAALVDAQDKTTALKQILAAYRINHVTDIYLESHFDCGAYRLAGVTFDNTDIELERLTTDLRQAANNVESALVEAGAEASKVTVHLRIVDSMGKLVWGS